MRRLLQAAGALVLALPSRAALACPFCAQDRGREIFLVAGLSLLPLLLATGIWMQVRRMERPGS